MPVTGQLIIGFDRVDTASRFHAVDPARGTRLEPAFAIAGAAEVEQACRLAVAAFEPYRQADLAVRAEFLEACASGILELGDELLLRAGQETGLPQQRLAAERSRTVAQLRLFAQVVRQGDWLGLRIDSEQPRRSPLPRPDLRQRRIPLGPVAVFGASNFPLAFSAAGGDVAAALAAGCPVVVKGHPSHPGTSTLAAAAVSTALRRCGLPGGTYSHLSGPGEDLGRALVAHRAIRAVGFTGSRAGGLALSQLAAARPEPIPVYAEMSSINPVILLPAALAARADSLASGFVASLTLGAGQFCTNPGLVLAIDGAHLDRFLNAAATALANTEPAQMLSARICSSYHGGIERLRGARQVTEVGRGLAAGATNTARSALFRVVAEDFLASPELGAEVFGPSSLVVVCRDVAQLTQVLEALEGQLTATLQLEAADHVIARRLLPILEQRAGRILANGWPTGVEVSHAMVHGGPFPATSDSRVTSVGTLAIERFLRPVCYQDLPPELLPPELTQAQGAQYRRLVDGRTVLPEAPS